MTSCLRVSDETCAQRSVVWHGLVRAGWKPETRGVEAMLRGGRGKGGRGERIRGRGAEGRPRARGQG